MNAILRGLLSGRFLRLFGLYTCMWSLAQAALIENWTHSFLLGVLLLGLGIGLGSWEFGGDR